MAEVQTLQGLRLMQPVGGAIHLTIEAAEDAARRALRQSSPRGFRPLGIAPVPQTWRSP
jgi:hypothetical protein